MIGNDIVDLKLANAGLGSRLQRFMDKVFHPDEQLLIRNAKNSHQMLWLLWSMKESAYKIQMQYLVNRYFDPKALRCELTDDFSGTVTADATIYNTNSILTAEYIYTTGCTQVDARLVTNYLKLDSTSYSNQHNQVHQSLLSHYANYYHLRLDDLSISKNEACIPHVFYKGNERPTPISLTHHGGYIGYAFIV